MVVHSALHGRKQNISPFTITMGTITPSALLQIKNFCFVVSQITNFCFVVLLFRKITISPSNSQGSPFQCHVSVHIKQICKNMNSLQSIPLESTYRESFIGVVQTPLGFIGSFRIYKFSWFEFAFGIPTNCSISSIQDTHGI